MLVYVNGLSKSADCPVMEIVVCNEWKPFGDQKMSSGRQWRQILMRLKLRK